MKIGGTYQVKQETVKFLDHPLSKKPTLPPWPGPDVDPSFPPYGFASSPVNRTLKKGEIFDRVTAEPTPAIEDFGRSAASAGTPVPLRALPLEKRDLANLKVYKIEKDIPDVDTGYSAPWFGEPGGCRQYHFGLDPQTSQKRTIAWLIDEGYISEL